ncbi:MAG: hypothetical protein ABI423_08600 [Burkholderiales bacterium]
MTPIGAIEASAWGVAMREPGWLPTAILTVHLVGVAALASSIAIVDTRLLGFWRRTSVRRLAACLLPVTAVSFLLIVPSGLLMFVAHASELIDSGVFALKMGLIFAAGVNAAVFHAGAFRGAAAWDVARRPPRAAQLAAAFSLALWSAVITCGVLLPVP